MKRSFDSTPSSAFKLDILSAMIVDAEEDENRSFTAIELVEELDLSMQLISGPIMDREITKSNNRHETKYAAQKSFEPQVGDEKDLVSIIDFVKYVGTQLICLFAYIFPRKRKCSDYEYDEQSGETENFSVPEAYNPSNPVHGRNDREETKMKNPTDSLMKAPRFNPVPMTFDVPGQVAGARSGISTNLIDTKVAPEKRVLWK